MSRRVHFVIPDDLIIRTDAAASVENVSRGEFVRRALEAMLTDETPRPSPAGREAKTEAASRPARSVAANRQGASRPSASPRTSAAKKAEPRGEGTPLPKIARKHWA